MHPKNYKKQNDLGVSLPFGFAQGRVGLLRVSLRFSNPFSLRGTSAQKAVPSPSHPSRIIITFFLFFFFSFFLNAQNPNPLPQLEYHKIYENNQHYTFIWIAQNSSNSGNWLVEHSFKGLEWKILQSFLNNQNLYQYSFPKNLYGFIRLRWIKHQDTTTLAVHNLNHTVKKGLFAYYDEEFCKVSIGYQISFQTDLLLRFYNSIGEELNTHFLYHHANELHFWNFEPQCLKKDIYLVRIIDALTKEIIADYRLPILYEATEKKPN